MAQDVVQIVFMQQEQVLLGFRQNTRAFSNLWGFPSGRMEAGETPAQSALREAQEEVAVMAEDLQLLCQLSAEDERQHYIFLCQRWQGDFVNAEPELCREIAWFPIHQLPDNCTAVTFQVLPFLQKYMHKSK